MLLLACAFDFPHYAYRHSLAQLRPTSVIAEFALGDFQHNTQNAESLRGLSASIYFI
jgi:hypothetical protein